MEISRRASVASPLTFRSAFLRSLTVDDGRARDPRGPAGEGFGQVRSRRRASAPACGRSPPAASCPPRASPATPTPCGRRPRTRRGPRPRRPWPWPARRSPAPPPPWPWPARVPSRTLRAKGPRTSVPAGEDLLARGLRGGLAASGFAGDQGSCARRAAQRRRRDPGPSPPASPGGPPHPTGPLSGRRAGRRDRSSGLPCAPSRRRDAPRGRSCPSRA